MQIVSGIEKKPNTPVENDDRDKAEAETGIAVVIQYYTVGWSILGLNNKGPVSAC